MTSKFQKRSACYTCNACNKRTRETGEGESGCQLCRECFVMGGIENSHMDNHSGRFADCPDCRDTAAVYGYTIPNEDSWCDSPEAASVTQ